MSLATFHWIDNCYLNHHYPQSKWVLSLEANILVWVSEQPLIGFDHMLAASLGDIAEKVEFPVMDCLMSFGATQNILTSQGNSIKTLGLLITPCFWLQTWGIYNECHHNCFLPGLPVRLIRGMGWIYGWAGQRCLFVKYSLRQTRFVSSYELMKLC